MKPLMKIEEEAANHGSCPMSALMALFARSVLLLQIVWDALETPGLTGGEGISRGEYGALAQADWVHSLGC